LQNTRFRRGTSTSLEGSPNSAASWVSTSAGLATTEQS